MFKRNPVRAIVVPALFITLFFAAAARAQDKWEPVSPSDLAQKNSTVEPDADAEVLFWEVRVDDSDTQQMVMRHYVRAKVFTEKGREKYSKIDIPFLRGIKIRDIKARVIKPDGTITELAKSDVFDQEIVRADKVKVRAKSFAVPGIEPGVIVEYRYQEVYSYGSAEDMRMEFQKDVPIRRKSYFFKPFQDARVLSFNMQNSGFQKDKGNFYRATLENIPALKAEPHMPPEDEVKSWMLVYYTSYQKDTATDFWSRAGGRIVKTFDVKTTLRPGKELTAKATELTAGITDPAQQMEKLFEFCKTRIKNISYDTSLTEDQKDEMKPNKNPADTLKKGQGTVRDINELFASLAAALGHETRLAFGGDRSEKFFDPTQAHESFVHFAAVAVNLGGRWHYYSPGDLFVPFGMLAWNEEDTAAILLGFKDYKTASTPISLPERSVAKRKGTFNLSENGTLEGNVEIEYTGHLSVRHKLDNYKDSENKREETLKELVKEKISTAELSDIVIENVTDPEKPFIYKYKVRVPNYAQKVGKRMFFRPGYFTNGSTPVFSSTARKYQVFFHYPWSEEDEISISLPAGYTLDNPDVPGSVADQQNIGRLNIQIFKNPAGSMITYRRKFHFGGGGTVLFPVVAYPAVKNMFDMFHKADTEQLSLIQQ